MLHSQFLVHPNIGPYLWFTTLKSCPIGQHMELLIHHIAKISTNNVFGYMFYGLVDWN